MADDKNTEVKNKSNKAINEMLKKAYAELGYTEEKGGYTKFGKWYGLPTSDWCAMFVCWTVYQGFGDAWTDYISKTAIANLPKLCVQHGKADWVRTPDGENKMKPQPGDIWAVRNYGHTGMVYEVDGDTIVTIEGNHSNKVASVRRKISSMTCIVRPHWGVPASTGGGSGVDLQQTIKTLLSSDSYTYMDLSKKEKKELKEVTEYKDAVAGTLRNLRKNINNNTQLSVNSVVDEALVSAVELLENEARKEIKKQASKTKGTLLSFPTWVQAPTVVITLNGITIGGYGNSGDKYPNYIRGLEAVKLNGRINEYTINLVHQIRFGEDPNTIDKLLSNTGYENKIHIKYGDSSVGMYYNEVEAVIRDVTYNESPQSSTITYTIKAISSIGAATSAYGNYASVTDKPSNIIRNLLYDNPNTSRVLQDKFAGMRDRQLVEKYGLIPNTDEVTTIGAMNNVDVVTYLTHVISCMHNDLSTYYLNYIDDKDNKLGGNHFKITEVSKTAVADNTIGQCYYVNVGYPTNNNVLNFTVDEDIYFPMIEEYQGNIKEYDYDIDNSGNIIQKQVNNMLTDNFGNQGNAESGWWNFITNYPIKSSLTIQGLISPIMLMTDIYIDANYYGWTDYTSGIYKVTGQLDKIDSTGCTSTLKLIKVTD